MHVYYDNLVCFKPAYGHGFPKGLIKALFTLGGQNVKQEDALTTIQLHGNT